MKKIFYGAGIIICWIVFELTLKYSGVVLGGVLYACTILFWLWLFARATGLKIWFYDNISDEERTKIVEDAAEKQKMWSFDHNDLEQKDD